MYKGKSSRMAYCNRFMPITITNPFGPYLRRIMGGVVPHLTLLTRIVCTKPLLSSPEPTKSQSPNCAMGYGTPTTKIGSSMVNQTCNPSALSQASHGSNGENVPKPYVDALWIYADSMAEEVTSRCGSPEALLLWNSCDHTIRDRPSKPKSVLSVHPERHA
jgi:hypothetical protein